MVQNDLTWITVLKEGIRDLLIVWIQGARGDRGQGWLPGVYTEQQEGWTFRNRDGEDRDESTYGKRKRRISDLDLLHVRCLFASTGGLQVGH